MNRADFNVCADAKVEDIRNGSDGIFTVMTATQRYRARAVVLALGRAGTPRKLGVKGEQLPKVMYRLIEADHYQNKRILVVGGGDSAVEAAMGLAQQEGNQVTLSYRQDAFIRIKARNAQRLEEGSADGKDQRDLQLNARSSSDKMHVILSVDGKLADPSQRSGLDLCRRHSSLRIPQEDRSRVRNAGYDG